MATHMAELQALAYWTGLGAAGQGEVGSAPIPRGCAATGMQGSLFMWPLVFSHYMEGVMKARAVGCSGVHAAQCWCLSTSPCEPDATSEMCGCPSCLVDGL